MEELEQIQKFQKFFEQNYHADLLEKVRKGEKFLTVDFSLLTKFDPELAELLLEQPEDTIKTSELAVEQFDLPGDSAGFKVRFRNLPESQRVMIRNIRSNHISKLLWMDGIVRQKSDVRPQVTSSRFECPSCGTIINVLQLDSKFKEPTRCGCGRKGKFHLLTKELVDAQSLTLEEAPEDLEGGEQPKRMKVLLKNDLVSPISDKRTNPGTKIQVVGQLKEQPIILRTGGQSTRFDLFIEANHTETVQEEFLELDISSEELEEIQELSQDPNMYSKMVQSVAPSIYGHERIKEALLCQIMGGIRKVRDDGTITRGDMHILLIGDPGSGKSAMLKRILNVAPKARYVSGKGATGAGLCVSPNSLVMTNPGGMVAIHRLVEDRSYDREQILPGVWKKSGINDVRVQSLSHNLRLHSKRPAALWKLKAPENVYEVVLSSGKKIELTGNTQLFSIKAGKPLWKKASDIKVGGYIATPRRLIGGIVENQSVISLVKSNPVVHGVKPFVKKILGKLVMKHGSVRAAAKNLGINENCLYHNWVNKKARGNIKLRSLQKICHDVHVSCDNEVKVVSLYNGKPHHVPGYLSKRFLYCAGLIAGDGDIQRSTHSYSVRLSNSCNTLQKEFRMLLEGEFGVSYDIQKGCLSRSEATRTSSKILAEILIALGIPISPKSNKLALSDTLLHLANPLLAEFVAGLYDADGSVCFRKGRGSDCVDFTTCSEKLARQLQLVLLRFGIHANLRSRPASNGLIQGNYVKWIVELRGCTDIIKFGKCIPLRHPKKRKSLKRIMGRRLNPNPNLDVIPGLAEHIKPILQIKGIPLKRVGWHPKMSRKRAKELLAHPLASSAFPRSIKQIVHSDIFWEKVVEVKCKKPSYNYVYDMTVEDSHNFVVDGVLVHNTAAVVKDEFLQGYSLEAGALVLANRGICLTGETEIIMDGAVKMMRDVFMAHKTDRNCTIGSIDFNTLEFTTSNIKHFSKRQARTNRIVLEHGDSLNITEEHPVLVWDNGYSWKAAKSIVPGDYIVTKRSFPLPEKYPFIADLADERVFVKINLSEAFPGINKSEVSRLLKIPKHRLEPANKLRIADIKRLCDYYDIRFAEVKKHISFQHLPTKVTPQLGEFVGLVLTDGHVSRRKHTIRFYNKSDVLITRFARLTREIFKVNPSFYTDRRSGVQQCYFSSQDVHTLLVKLGIAKGNKSKTDADLFAIRQMPAEFLHAFFGGVLNGDGCICDRETGGLIDVVGGNRETLEQIRKCIRPLGILGRVKEYTSYGGGVTLRRKSTLFKLSITGVDNFRRIKAKYLTDFKAHKLKSIKRAKDTSSRIPKTDALFHSLNAKLPHTEKKLLYRNSIKISNLANKSLSGQVVARVVGELAAVNPARDTSEVKLLKKILDQDMVFLKVLKKISTGTNTVYNLQVDMHSHPNYFANFIPVHNCMIDELDKMSRDDRSAMHEALEQQTVSISKANIQATLRAETTVLAAANPKFGRFDPYGNIAEQIDLPSTLINRFDLIFPIKDLPDEDKDDKMASFILNLHKDTRVQESPVPTSLLRKYIAYAKQTIKPQLTDGAMDEMKAYYLKMRASGATEGAVKSIPISARQLEGLIRMGEAVARLRLGNKVTRRDAKRAIALLDYCLRQIALDEETGTIDIDRIATGITTTQRTRIVNIREIIMELENKIGKTIPIEDIMTMAKERGIDEGDVDSVIEKLKRSGDLFEPRRGFVSRL